MESKVAAFAATPDPMLGQRQSNAQPATGGRGKAAGAGPDPVDLRLVIEEDQNTGGYVYKTINRRTGEVIQQLPRQEVLRMKEETRYATGAVIRTRA